MARMFPPDEFDDIAPVDRRGAHRVAPAKLGGVTASVFVAILAIAAILLGIAVFNIVRSGQAGPDNPVVSGQDGGQSTDEGSPPASSSSSPSATESDSADVDRSEKVSVLNSTAIKGLATKAATRLKEADWTRVTAGNVKSPLTTTTVYYSSDDLKSTAEAVAQDLGTETTEMSDAYTAPITVIIASDYKTSG